MNIFPPPEGLIHVDIYCADASGHKPPFKITQKIPPGQIDGSGYWRIDSATSELAASGCLEPGKSFSSPVVKKSLQLVLDLCNLMNKEK